MSRRLYPIYLDLSRRFVVVVGGGAVAERKALGLLEAGAELRIVAPEASEKIQALFRERKLEWLKRPFHPLDVEGAFLCFAATDDPAVNTKVCQACDQAGVLVNRAESPEASDFILPAVFRRGRLSLAISTDGASPHLGQIVRDRLEKEYGPEYGDFVDLLEAARVEIMERIKDPSARRDLLRRLAESDDLLEIIRKVGKEAAMKRVREMIGY